MVSLFWILWEKGYYYFIFWCTEDTGDITLQSSLRTSKWGIGYVAQSNKQIQFLKLWDQIIIGSRIDVIAIKDFITLQVTFENSDNMMELPIINYDQKQVWNGPLTIAFVSERVSSKSNPWQDVFWHCALIFVWVKLTFNGMVLHEDLFRDRTERNSTMACQRTEPSSDTDIFWPRSKIPSNWRKPENSEVLW